MINNMWLIRFLYIGIILIQLTFAFDGYVDWMNWLSVGWIAGLWTGLELHKWINRKRNG